jgi:hypothetical protein
MGVSVVSGSLYKVMIGKPLHLEAQSAHTAID